MKKTLSLALAAILLLSATPHKPVVAATISQDLLAMENIGLIRGTGQGITQQYASEKTTNNQLRTILLRMNLPQSEFLTKTLDTLDSKTLLSVESFYKIFLELLGYENTTTNVLEYAHTLGFNVPNTDHFTNEQLAVAFNECLKAKTASGQEFFECLISYGFLSDYNANKEIPEILVFDGKSQPIFNHDEAIYEMVYVESPQDTDLDGKRDLIEVWIKRPIETEAGMKVPAIFEVSPYLQGTNDDLYDLHPVDEDLTVGNTSTTTLEDVTYVSPERNVPAPREVAGLATNGQVEPFDFGGWYNYFLPRGYAVVFSGGIGTHHSEGMTSTGGEEEIISTVAVIDWLNGKTKAFTNKTDNIEVRADWCTGNVGMSGRSYRGTLPIGVAATGVEGLKTIVPVAAISNWYDYYRANGLNVAGEGWQGDDCDLLAIYCMSRMFDEADYLTVKENFETSMEQMRQAQDRITGDYNTFWDERNYLNNVDKIDASVFIVHGLSDWNVRPNQFNNFWEKLQENNVPSKIVLHQGEHISIDNLAGIDFNDIMNEWFAYWLYDINNDVMDTVPTATIQNNTTMAFEGFESWPVKATNTTLYLENNGTKGTLSLSPNTTVLKETYSDDLSLSGYNRQEGNALVWRDAIVGNPEEKRADRLAYTSEVLSTDLRISGTPHISLTASLDKPTGIISAMLVDYGTDYRPTINTEVVVPNGINYGGNAGTDDIVDFIMSDEATDYKIITRGWMDAQNRIAPYRIDSLTPNTEYTFELDLEPMDYTLKAGHKLGLIIYSTDAEYTMRPLSVTNFEVNTSQTSITIPFVSDLTSW